MKIPVITAAGRRATLTVTCPLSARYLEDLPPRCRAALLSYDADVVLSLVKPSLDGEPWPLVDAYDWPRADAQAAMPEGVTLPTSGLVLAMTGAR